MKHILITGANSYIGTSFERYMAQWPERYHVDTIDMRDDAWQQMSFAGYNSVFHVAGIAHADVGKVTDAQKALYYRVNTELAIKTAQKAKADHVRQFIYMSSAIVYGDSAPIGKQKIINKDTRPAPASFYGDSKLKAEEGILPMQSEGFNVVILRPPMIYGKDSKGNYSVLAKYARMLPIFPNVKNQRSILYIENLCEFVRLIVDNDERGVFWPQNKEVINTADVVRMIARAHGKKIVVTGLINWPLYIMRLGTGIVDKAFGSLAYDQRISEYKEEYRLVSLEESIKRAEK